MVSIKSRIDFIAGSENEYINRAINYKNKLLFYKDILGLSDEKITEETTKIENLVNKKHIKDELQKKTTSEVESFNCIKDKLTRYMRMRRPEIQALPGYTKAIGIDLGLEPSYTFSETDNLTPEIKVTLDGGFPRIKFYKRGTQGLRIYCRINGEGQFSFLNTCTKRSYLDGRPKKDPQEPEIREYYAFFILDDKTVGKQSATVKISM